MNLELIAIAISLLTTGSLIGGWIWQASKISARSEDNREGVADALARATEAKEAAEAASREVTQLELRMTRDFASNSHLKEVEGRLIGAVNNLTNEIGQLRAFLMQHGSGHE